MQLNASRAASSIPVQPSSIPVQPGRRVGRWPVGYSLLAAMLVSMSMWVVIVYVVITIFALFF